MSEKKLHIGQAFYLPQLLEELRQCGVNTQRLVKRTVLKYFDLTEPDKYIPLRGIYQLLELLQKDQGIDHLAKQFYHLFTLTPNNNVARQVLQSPTLLHAMQTGVKFQHLSKTNYQLSLEIDGCRAIYKSDIIDQPTKGWELEQDIDLIRVLDTISTAAGKDWRPHAIYLTRSSLDGIDFMLPPGDYPVYLNQKSKKVVLDIATLASTMPKLPHEYLQLDSVETKLSLRIEKLLLNQAPSTFLSLSHISELVHASTRTMQRTLQQEGTSFSEIAIRVRFIRAIELLKSGIQVKEVSQQLGYEEATNFVRAFKAWTGITPSAYQY